MNILPKKRWHVRTKDNIARVRKDEAAAREEELKKQEKFELAESEARVNFLRTRSGLPEKHSKVVAENVTKKQESLDRFSLFADYKSHVKTTNKDLEKEKKDEQEKYEKQIGYLTYLGQDTNETLRLKSWYEVPPRRQEVDEDGEVAEKDMKNKHSHDPLTFIKALLPPEQKIEHKPSLKRKRTPTLTTLKDSFKESKRLKKQTKEIKKRKKEKHKKYQKERKEHKKKNKSKDLVEEDMLRKRLKLEQLRKERLRREAAEKPRQYALLAPLESKKQSESALATPRVIQKYNSQFNPELAKQNMQ